MSESSKAPFIGLGRHLKYVREQSRQSLPEVSGAVEIDESLLERIEAGITRPAEDVLLLLISHFGVQDQEAVQLWEMANYDGELPEQLRLDNDVVGGNKIVMLMTVDMRTMYSDGVGVQVSPSGLTLNFTQTSGQGQPLPVARVGMSAEQAQQVLIELQRALLKIRFSHGPKALPPPTQS